MSDNRPSLNHFNDEPNEPDHTPAHSEGEDNAIQPIGTGERESLKDSAWRKSLEELFTRDNMELKSDLTQPMVLSLVRGRVFAEKYTSKTMNSLVDHLLELSVSKGRKGREEFVRLIRSGQDEPATGGDERQFIDKLMGR